MEFQKYNGKEKKKKKTRSIKLSKIYMKFALKKNRVEDTFFFLGSLVQLRSGEGGRDAANK